MGALVASAPRSHEPPSSVSPPLEYNPQAGLAGNDVLGMAGSSNVQGEDQKKLDLVANEVFKNVLARTGQCAVLVTEEEEEPIFIRPEQRGEYCVVFDPLDGSSNIDCGVSIGTIFGIYKVAPGSEGSLADVLRPGRDMVAAGYCMYGSMTYLMLSTGRGVSGFTLDPSLGEFVATHRDLVMPPRGSIYSINEGNAAMWDAATSAYVAEKKRPPGGGKPYSLRYVGSMVADVHRTLLYGGVFLYPADAKNTKVCGVVGRALLVFGREERVPCSCVEAAHAGPVHP